MRLLTDREPTVIRLNRESIKAASLSSSIHQPLPGKLPLLQCDACFFVGIEGPLHM